MTAELHEIADLLRETFPGADRLGDVSYLRWLYEDNPDGPVVSQEVLDHLGVAGHYAIVPITIAVDGAESRAALSLNTAVHDRARGGGVFVSLAERTYAMAAASEIAAVVGVANANSTPGFVRRLQFSIIDPLPVTVLVPRPGRSTVDWRSARAATPASHELLRDPPQPAGVRGFQRSWNEERLAWRLNCPGSSYAVHRCDDILMVTTVERRGPVRIAVILAVLAQRPLTRSMSASLVREACRFHRAPVALHAGFNDRVRFRGVPLPDRLKPSPLNLIARRLTSEDTLATPARFEFLDFDAY